MTSHCSNCGSPITVGDRFCGGCGQPIFPAGEVRGDFGKSADAAQPTSHRSRTLVKAGLVVAGAILLAVGDYQAMQHDAPASLDIANPAAQGSRDGHRAVTAMPPEPAAPQPPGVGERSREFPKPEEKKEAADTPDVNAGRAKEPLATPQQPNDAAGPAPERSKLFPQGQETARAAPQPISPSPSAESDAGPGWLGINIQDIDADMASALGLAKAEGAIVAEVIAGGPAFGKLEAGDAILEIDGQSVRDAVDAKSRFGSHAPGEPVRLRVLRNGNRVLIAVRLGTWSDSPDSAK